MVALANGWQMNTTAPRNGRKADALVDATGDMCVRCLTTYPFLGTERWHLIRVRVQRSCMLSTLRPHCRCLSQGRNVL